MMRRRTAIPHSDPGRHAERQPLTVELNSETDKDVFTAGRHYTLQERRKIAGKLEKKSLEPPWDTAQRTFEGL